MDTLLILLFGALGGAARGLVGFAKYYTSYKNVSFSWIYFAITIGISAMVGLGATWTLHSSGITFEGINLNPAVAFMFGYGGGDAIENLYKILVKQPVLGPFSSILKVTGKR